MAWISTRWWQSHSKKREKGKKRRTDNSETVDKDDNGLDFSFFDSKQVILSIENLTVQI